MALWLEWKTVADINSNPSGLLVYTERGPMVMDSLDKALSSLGHTYSVQTTTSEKMIAGDWMDDSRLLVMPGGRDLPYVKELEGQRNDNIRQLYWWRVQATISSVYLMYISNWLKPLRTAND